MSEVPSPVITCVLGAGFAREAGVPLASELFESRDLIAVSGAAQTRLVAVARAHAAWRKDHPNLHAELFVQYVYSSHSPPVPFQWVAEWIAVATASPQTTPAAANARYLNAVRAPLRIPSYTAFWTLLTEHVTELAVVSFNYDLVIERSLRDRPMVRPRLPGFYYGGLSQPQRLHGSPAAPWKRRADSDPLSGRVPLCKLHGSVNWSLVGSEVRLWHDARPCFRSGSDAAMIPPFPEKDVVGWARPIWECARSALARAGCWVVCGYSLPAYDVAAVEMLRSAAGGCERVLVLDPSPAVVTRWKEVVPRAIVERLPRFPAGLGPLASALGRLF